MADTATRHAFSVDEWHRMGALFDEDARVELVEGDVLELTPIGERHALTVTRLNRLFSARVGDLAVVSVQNPVILDQHSELQPDLALLVPPLERYRSHPTAADLYLVIEVADTSLVHDRDRKAALYGGAGVPETWVVDLAGEIVIVLTEPDRSGVRGYRVEQRIGRGGMLGVGALPGLALSVDQVLGLA